MTEIREFKCQCGHTYEAIITCFIDLFDHNECPECGYYFVPSRPKGDQRLHWSPVDNLLKEIAKA